MISRIIHILVAQCALLFCLFSPFEICAQSFVRQTPTGTFGKRENNIYAPELYAKEINFIATLVDLPGAKNTKSYWELSYQLYFIPEDKYYEALERMPAGSANPGPEQFPGKILLAEAHAKKAKLATLKERTHISNRLPFKDKIPDPARTKFARVMTSYSIKIFDAELNTTVYRSGIFLTKPYDQDTSNSATPAPRQTIYLNFMISPQGVLNRSQSPRKADDITWR
jgi:hypothetical protein